MLIMLAGWIAFLVGYAVAADQTAGVVSLCKAGMSEDLIVIAAKQQPAANLTIEQILSVRTACGEAVLRVLMQPVAVMAQSAPVTTNGSAVSSPGFHMVVNGKTTPILPAKLRRTGFKKGLGGLASLAKMAPKMLAELDGGRAEIRTSSQPNFILSGDATEYSLVRLESKGDKRQVVVGKGGLMGARGEFDSKSLISFRVDKDTSRVSLDRPLEAGEYMFYPRDAFEASGETTLNLTGQAFPFGVD